MRFPACSACPAPRRSARARVNPLPARQPTRRATPRPSAYRTSTLTKPPRQSLHSAIPLQMPMGGTTPMSFGEGAGQSVTGTATDRAGNTATFTVSNINIDKTAPTISAQRDTAANAYGWNNTDVLSSYAASDALSGLSSPGTGGFTFTS